MNHRERLEKCLAGEKVDRVPVALWRHFPVDDQNPYLLARATLDFQRTFDFDLVKITPASSFCVKDWGSDDVWRGATEGTRDYVKSPIVHPEDWENLKMLDPRKGKLGEHLLCVQEIVKKVDQSTPVIQTIFSPLSQAKNLASKERLLVWMRRYPNAFKEGLEIITATTIRYIEELKKIGIDGIFYAVQHAQYGLLSEDEYDEFGKPYDLRILEAVKGLWLNMLHIHGEDIMFDKFCDYPVQIINWHDRETPPSLAEAKNKFPRAVCGGIKRIETMVLGTPEEVEKEAKEAIEATSRERFILGTGCVTPITAPIGNLLALRECVDKM